MDLTLIKRHIPIGDRRRHERLHHLLRESNTQSTLRKSLALQSHRNIIYFLIYRVQLYNFILKYIDLTEVGGLGGKLINTKYGKANCTLYPTTLIQHLVLVT